MTPERLAAIVAAYGTNPARWPEAERADALLLMGHQGGTGGQAHEVDELDVLLGCYEVPPLSMAARTRALDGIPARVDLSILRRWWVGLVVTGAGLAGVAAGVLTLLVMTPHLEDRELMSMMDEQVTIFTPLDIEEDAL